MGDVLATICAEKRAYVDRLKRRKPLGAVLDDAHAAPPPRGFVARLEAAVAHGGYGLIAEIKRASPSKGLIRKDFHPATLARAYERGGATCLSVLTDTRYFHGADDHLAAARAVVEMPVLRKDFMVDPYQIIESRALGADCVLLIMAALGDTQARELEDLAFAHGMDALLEVHDEDELARALKLRSRLIGINNRDLRTLKTDIETTRRLAGCVPGGRILVSESGLNSRKDLDSMAKVGVRCFLVGESLMRRADVEAATRALLAPPGDDAPAARKKRSRKRVSA